MTPSESEALPLEKSVVIIRRVSGQDIVRPRLQAHRACGTDGLGLLSLSRCTLSNGSARFCDSPATTCDCLHGSGFRPGAGIGVFHEQEKYEGSSLNFSRCICQMWRPDPYAFYAFPGPLRFTMELERYGEPWSYAIALLMQGLQNPDYPIEDLGDCSLEISTKLRCLAIVALLTQGDTDLFYQNA